MLNDKIAGVLTLIDIRKEWMENQTFLRINQDRPPVNLLPCFTLHLLFLAP